MYTATQIITINAVETVHHICQLPSKATPRFLTHATQSINDGGIVKLCVIPNFPKFSFKQLLLLRHSSLRLWFPASVLDRRASLVVVQSKPLRRPRSRVGCVLYNVSSEKDIRTNGREPTKLRSQRAILGHTCPLIGPSLVPVRTNTDHGLDGEAHARLC